MRKAIRRQLNKATAVAKTHGVESDAFISECRKLHTEMMKFTGFTGNVNSETDIDIHCNVAFKMDALLAPVFCGDYTIEPQIPGEFLLKGFDYEESTDYIVASI